MAKLKGPYVVAAVNPASIGAVGAVNIDLAVPEARLNTHQALVFGPPGVLEAGVVVQGAFVQAEGNVRARLTNASAGAIDPAAGDYTVYLIEEG